MNASAILHILVHRIATQGQPLVCCATALILGGLTVSPSRAVEESVAYQTEVGQAASREPQIYHAAWIDLNKNGMQDHYEDRTLDVPSRIKDLLDRMTIDEKTCQMATLYGFPRVLQDELPSDKWLTKLWKDGIGNIDEHANGNTNYGRKIKDPDTDLPHGKHTETINQVQRFFIERTRLGIPADFTNEGVRGLLHTHATSFPSPLGVAASWDLGLVHAIGKVTAAEARALGYTHVYAPILDLPRDPRWGRTCECYSEDPFLTAECGVAMVEALQANGVASTCKHFAVYGVPNGGRDGDARTDPQVTWQETQTVHLHPFREVVRRAKPMGVMSSYNDYGGSPVQSSRRFLTTILREEWGFNGYVVSDSGAVEFVHRKHRIADSKKEAVRLSVEAGLNVRTNFTKPEDFVLPLRELVREGRITQEMLDSRVADVLRVKFQLGLFDNPYREPSKVEQVVRSEEHQALALQAARESIVLLKNEAGLLPLSKGHRRILVTGPLADNNDAWWDRYGPQRVDYVTPLEGIREKFGDSAEVIYAQGCPVVDERFPESDVYKVPPSAPAQAMIDEAVSAAHEADVVIAVLGEDGEISRENRSRISLDLPGNQGDLLRALHATGKPVVLVLSSGRPLSVAWADEHVPAVLQMWFSNEPGGHAIADVLVGDYNPAGKLPVTVPKSVGQIPMAFPVKPAAQSEDGGQVCGPLYPFGHGLSYTTFEYSDLSVAPATASIGDTVTVSCRLTNTGDRAGDEVVQLYLRDDYSSVTTFEKSLRGFRRVSLAPGETRSVSFTLTPDDMQLFNGLEKWVVEPGGFTVYVSSSSSNDRLVGSFEVVDGMEDRPAIAVSYTGGGAAD